MAGIFPESPVRERRSATKKAGGGEREEHRAFALKTNGCRNSTALTTATRQTSLSWRMPEALLNSRTADHPFAFRFQEQMAFSVMTRPQMRVKSERDLRENAANSLLIQTYCIRRTPSSAPRVMYGTDSRAPPPSRGQALAPRPGPAQRCAAQRSAFKHAQAGGS
jgi:hypothetical protein